MLLVIPGITAISMWGCLPMPRSTLSNLARQLLRLCWHLRLENACFINGECSLDTPPLLRHPQHHELVTRGTELIAEQTKTVSGTSDNKRSAAARTYFFIFSRRPSNVPNSESKLPL